MIVRSTLTVLGLAMAVLAPAQAADFSRIGPLAPAASILAARPALREPALEFVYRVEGGNRPGTTTLDLARDFIAAREADGTVRIHDFALRRIIVADATHHGFTNGSLYGLVDFLRAETYNRRQERILFEKVHVADATKYFAPFWVQSELQILDPEDGTPDLVRREDAGGVHFSYDGVEIASYTRSKQVLTPDQGVMLRKFLAFNSSLHPRIIQDIVGSGYLPQHLSVTLPPMWKKPAAVWTLQSAAAVEAAYPLTADATPGLAPSQPPPLADVLPLMQAAVAGRAPGLHSAADYRAAIETAFAQGRNFQAALTAFEFILQYGAPAAGCAPSANCAGRRSSPAWASPSTTSATCCGSARGSSPTGRARSWPAPGKRCGRLSRGMRSRSPFPAGQTCAHCPVSWLISRGRRSTWFTSPALRPTLAWRMSGDLRWRTTTR